MAASEMNRLHWLEISRSALLHNLNSYRKIIDPKTKIMSVTKANAYGHGLAQVTPIVSPQSDFLMVNAMEEALIIRKLKIKTPILIAAPIHPSNISLAAKHKISLCVHSLKYLNSLKSHPHILVHLKINTGTNRLGLEPSEVPTALEIIRKSKSDIEGVYTHFHSSDSGSAATEVQFDRFQQAVSQTKYYFPQCLAHCSSSSASLLRPEMQLDMIRLGISLYGLWPDPYVSKNSPATSLRPVLSWLCCPVQIRKINAGESVSYAAAYKYKKPGIMAVLPIGYSDGFDRKLSNLGRVWISGNYYPIIGRVAMNFTCIDISGSHPVISEKDQVELIGPHISADEIASKIGTINYEIVSRLNPSIPRIIVK